MGIICMCVSVQVNAPTPQKESIHFCILLQEEREHQVKVFYRLGQLMGFHNSLKQNIIVERLKTYYRKSSLKLSRLLLSNQVFYKLIRIDNSVVRVS